MTTSHSNEGRAFELLFSSTQARGMRDAMSMLTVGWCEQRGRGEESETRWGQIMADGARTADGVESGGRRADTA
jgi:hypothetical protein